MNNEEQLPPMPSDADNVTPQAKTNGKRKRPPPQRPVFTDWRAYLHQTKRGDITSCAANVATILRHDPTWAGVLEHDERIGVPRFATAPPLPRDLANPRDTYPRELADADLVRAQAWIARTYEFCVGLDAISTGIDAVAAQRPRDPVREYLDTLRWDEVPRIDTWAHVYLGAADSEYTRGVGARWLTSAIARTYAPGCQADHVLILEGRQGSGKSTALRTLAGRDDFFSDEIQALGTKDAADGLRGPWIIELAELDAAHRADVTVLKAFVSRRVDRFRAAYGRRTLNHPRRCVFAATTNEHAYARDATGARRLWPIRTGRIDTDAIAGDRDQLWAEAIVRYRAGGAWWPDRNLETLATEEQDARYHGDEWESIVDAYVHGRTGEVTVREIASLALKIVDAKLAQADQNRIVRALVRLGWVRTPNPVYRVLDVDGRIIGEPGENCRADEKQRVRVYRRADSDTGNPSGVSEAVSDATLDSRD